MRSRLISACGPWDFPWGPSAGAMPVPPWSKQDVPGRSSDISPVLRGETAAAGFN